MRHADVSPMWPDGRRVALDGCSRARQARRPEQAAGGAAVGPAGVTMASTGRPRVPIFAGDFLAEEALRREIHSGLQVVENWNSANEVVFYGKDGKLTGSDREHVEVSMLALHLFQSCLVYINTLLLQRVLDDPKRAKKLTAEDRRALNALFWTNVNPYGRFRLDMATRLDLDLAG
jgi:hypothetical protein